MTQGEAQQPDARTGGAAGNPDTFKNLTISKFGGMNTVSPRGVFGQPNLLLNIVLDRLGGYAAAPSPRTVNTFPSSITGAAPLDGIQRVFVKTTGGAHYVNLLTGEITHTYVTSSPNITPYERGSVITWDTSNPLSSITAHTIAADGTVVVTDLISKTPLTFTFVEYDEYVAGGGGLADIITAVTAPGETVFEDTFDRTNGTLGGDWTSGDLRIDSNKVKQTGPVNVAYYTGSPVSNNWQQVSATLTEGAALIFHADSGLTTRYAVKLTTGRGVLITQNDNILVNLGVVPGTDPVHVEATFQNHSGEQVSITVNGGQVLTPYLMRLSMPPKFGIQAEGTGTVDLFRYSKMTVIVAEPAPDPVVTPMPDANSYPAGTHYGFDPRITHYVMFYEASYTYTTPPKLGTTLNPRPGAPEKIRPTILCIPPNPAGLTREYKIVFNNPGNLDYQFYGAALPELRRYTEYIGTPLPNGSIRSEQGVQVLEGTLVAAIPATKAAVQGSSILFGDLKMLYQALNSGRTAGTAPAWSEAVGSTVVDGAVTWLNRGLYFTGSRQYTFADYVARVASPPFDYIPPEIKWEAVSNDLGEWGQLYATGTPGGAVEVYRSGVKEPVPFYPHSFFPVGQITELHLSRTWVVADAVWRTYARQGGGVVAGDIESPEWEQATSRRTVYYSEPDTPWLFLERFIGLSLDKSREIVAMRSLGDYLVFLGDSDGVVLAGDSEANFYTRSIDIPGAFSQETTAVHAGVLYYRGVGGIYQLEGGRAKKISTPIDNRIPKTPLITESMSIDDTAGRLYVRVSDSEVLCYDMTSDAWTVMDFAGQLLQIGDSAYLADGINLRAVDGAPTAQGVIQYLDIDGGAAESRKQLKSVSGLAEAGSGSASVDLTTRAHRTGVPVSAWSEMRRSPVIPPMSDVRWRTPDRVGYAFDIEIRLNPAGSSLVLKPSLSLEMYRDAVIRRGYGGPVGGEGSGGSL